jgi:hypothetical protein
MTIYDYGRSPECWLLALDIATRNVKRVELADLATDVWCWMEANDFDVTFTNDGTGRIIRRDRIAASDSQALVADFAEKLPKERRYRVDLSMQDAFQSLSTQKWIVLADGNRIAGMVTWDDLAKPAASAFVFAHLVTIERVLRRLIGTYSSRPLGDEPQDPEGIRDDQEVPDVTYFSQAINRAGAIKPLLSDLGLSSCDFRKVGSWAISFRNHLAHSRRFSHGEPCEPTTLERFFRVQDLMIRLLRTVEDRSQVWRAFQESIIVSRDGGHVYAGSNAVELPFPGDCFVITAANPFEQRMEEDVNQHRNRMLLEILVRRTDQIIEVIGRSRCGNWSESSFMIAGISEAALLDIAKKFGKRAVFKLTETEKLVVATDGIIKGRTARCERFGEHAERASK